MTIYISGALKGSRDISSARDLYEKAALFVVESGATAFLPHASTDPVFNSSHNSKYVFQKDMAALKNSSGMIAFLNEPSLGVGAELAVCLYERIPVIGLAHIGSNVSRFAEGCLIAAGGALGLYESTVDIRNHIDVFVRRNLQYQYSSTEVTVARRGV